MDIQSIIENVDAPGIAELRVILKRSQEPINAGETDAQVEILRRVFDDDNFDVQEQMIILLLDDREDLIASYTISSGTADECRADFSKILRAAAVVNADSLVIAHNHPTGKALPSRADVQFANSIQHCLRWADFDLNDMIILTRDDHYSFAENGQLID